LLAAVEVAAAVVVAAVGHEEPLCWSPWSTLHNADDSVTVASAKGCVSRKRSEARLRTDDGRQVLESECPLLGCGVHAHPIFRPCWLAYGACTEGKKCCHHEVRSMLQ
jgi:hypothetical protein